MIAGLYNFRDVGGLPTRTGTVRQNRLFRSAQPGEITPEGSKSLFQLGITTTFDLRSTVEIHNYDFMQVRDMNGITRVAVPIFTNSDTSQQISKRRNYALGQPVTSYPHQSFLLRHSYTDLLRASNKNTEPFCKMVAMHSLRS